MFRNHFFAQSTITEFYRTDAYVEQMKAGIKKLDMLMTDYKKSPSQKAWDEISEELQYLKATKEEMEDFIGAQVLQQLISGEMIELGKEVQRMTEKAEKIIKDRSILSLNINI